MIEFKSRVEIVSVAFTKQAITSLTKYSSVGLTNTGPPIEHFACDDTLCVVVFISTLHDTWNTSEDKLCKVCLVLL